MRQEVKKYIDTADEKVVKMIHAMLEVDSDNDWWNNMPDEVKADFEIARQESENGETIPHEEIQKRYKKWLVSWTPRAWKTYEANIEYLLKEWTEKEVSRFVKLIDDKFFYLAKHPQIGSPRNKKYPNIRNCVVHKRIALIYRHKPSKNEIVYWYSGIV